MVKLVKVVMTSAAIDITLPQDSPPAMASAKVRPYIIGIDPGLSGATAVYDYVENKIVAIQDMPTVLDKKTKKKHIVSSELASFIGIYADCTALAVMEDVHAMPGQGVTSMFRFGFATGICHGIIGSYLLPHVAIKPSVWKGLMGLNSEKHLSVERIKSLFPKQIDLFPASKDGRAEAALLAIFGKRML